MCPVYKISLNENGFADMDQLDTGERVLTAQERARLQLEEMNRARSSRENVRTIEEVLDGELTEEEEDLLAAAEREAEDDLERDIEEVLGELYPSAPDTAVPEQETPARPIVASSDPEDDEDDLDILRAAGIDPDEADPADEPAPAPAPAAPAPAADSLICPICRFPAASKLGLSSHMRAKHPEAK